MGDVEFFSFPPRAELAPFVETIWGVRGMGTDPVEAVVPNGAIELMVNFGPTQEVVGRGDHTVLERYRYAWLAGIQDRRLVHCSRLGADHISVRFCPGGAHAFFELPMDTLANQVIELDLLVGSEARSLRDRLGVLSSDRSRSGLFQDWLLGRRRVHSAFELVRRALDILDRCDARAPIAAVCDDLGISNKHLVSQFRRLVGLPPKVVGRIQRFQRVIQACGSREEVDWLDLVDSCGYADQSHLIREFRGFAGLTPSEFLVVAAPEQ
jgi:AraC-like DNA-binding protein